MGRGTSTATIPTPHADHRITDAVTCTAVERGSRPAAHAGPAPKGSTSQDRRTSQGRAAVRDTLRDLRTWAPVTNAAPQ